MSAPKLHRTQSSSPRPLSRYLVLVGLPIAVLSTVIWWRSSDRAQGTREASTRQGDSALQETVESNRSSAPKLATPASPLKELLSQDLARRQTAYKAWRALKDVPLSQLISTPLQEPDAGQRGETRRGMLGMPLSAWRDHARREGFDPVKSADRPTMKSGPTLITLRVRDGVILGAEVSFTEGVDDHSDERPIASGPEWARVASLLAGDQVLGGADDPMMMFDPAPPPEEEPSLNGSSSDPSSTSPNAQVAQRTRAGTWGSAGRYGVTYHLELNERGEPVRGRAWLTAP